jgi:tripartite ATP-independent transporter DctM subunit
MPSSFTLCIIVLIALALFGLPIGLSMICASVFYLLLAGLDLGTAGEQILNGLFNSYVLLAVPLFILAADLMNSGSLTDRLLKFCLVLVGRFRGGLGHVNVVANIIFAGMSGSAIADAVGIGRIIIGMMTRNGKYPIEYAAAITASAAIIGPIIPPSIPMVVYALVSDTSIGYLFLGGVIPGLLLGLAFMIMNTVIARRRKYPVEPPVPMRNSAHPLPRRHLWRGDDADGGRGSRGSVRAVGIGAHIPLDLAQAVVHDPALQREIHYFGGNADRRGIGLQLRGDD